MLYISDLGSVCQNCFEMQHNSSKKNMFAAVTLQPNYDVMCYICKFDIQSKYAFYTSLVNNIDYCMSCYKEGKHLNLQNSFGYKFHKVVTLENRPVRGMIVDDWEQLINFIKCDGCNKLLSTVNTPDTNSLNNKNVIHTSQSTPSLTSLNELNNTSKNENMFAKFHDLTKM